MTTAKIVLYLYDGARKPLDPSLEVLVTIRDGHQQEHYDDHYSAFPRAFEVPFHNNAGDDYAVLASASKRVDAGFYPVRVSPQVAQPVHLMLLPKKSTLNFGEATWAKLRNNHAAIHGLLARGVNDAEGKERYEKFMTDAPGSLAAFFNITTAMRHIHLPSGGAFDYFLEMIWDPKLMQQDRFYAWADARLVDQVVLAAEQGKFEPQSLLSLTHKGATRSYKHKQFGEANVQFSFHEKDRQAIKVGGEEIECVKVEVDMDYFRNPLAHFILEGLGNAITKGDTDPRQIYVLRWTAGHQAGVPPFEPPYTIEPKQA